MGLSWLVVGVLPNDNNLDLLEGTEVEGVEYETGWRIADGGAVLLTYGGGELLEVGLVKFLL